MVALALACTTPSSKTSVSPDCDAMGAEVPSTSRYGSRAIRYERWRRLVCLYSGTTPPFWSGNNGAAAAPPHLLRGADKALRVLWRCFYRQYCRNSALQHVTGRVQGSQSSLGAIALTLVFARPLTAGGNIPFHRTCRIWSGRWRRPF